MCPQPPWKKNLLYPLWILLVVLLLAPAIVRATSQFLPQKVVISNHLDDLRKINDQLSKGDQALKEGNNDYAFLCYKKALDDLSLFQKVNYQLRSKIIYKLSHATLLLAKECLLKDDIKGAKNLIKELLIIDPNNKEATQELNKINNSESSKIVDKENNELINEVDQSWTLPNSNKKSEIESTINNEPCIKDTNINANAYKLHTIKFANIEFTETNLSDALDYIKQKAILLDTDELDPAKKGINIVLQFGPHGEGHTIEPKITLSFTDIPLEDLLKYIAQQAKFKIKVEPYALVMVPESDFNETLITKEYKIPPNFFSKLSLKKSQETSDNSIIHKEIDRFCIKDFLISEGISFPEGASANYLINSSLLIVKNNQTNLDLIDALVRASLIATTSQVEIEARFLEIKQNSLHEIGCDWLLGSFQLAQGKGVNGGGGTVGNQATYNNANFPLQNNGVPAGIIPGGPPGAGSVTSGNRTGSAAISANALETLLLGSPTGPAAGVLALAGIFTTPQFQAVLRGLNQQKGVNLLSSPKVTVNSGNRAIITIAKEFPYPAEYTPPQIPQNQGGSVNPATPTTPASFKTRNVGVELEVEPIVNLENHSIELSLSPQITEFQGFVNYGTPIFSQAPIFLGTGQNNTTIGTSQVLLTQNTINQPVFSVRQVDTQVTLRDGQTVVLGGLLREDIQKVQDKTPIVGNLPLVGHLFRSSSSQKIKRNLLIFVTVRLVTPSGQPLSSTPTKY